MRLLRIVVVCGLLGACSDPQTIETRMPTLRTERDQFGLITCSEATPEHTCYTHRTILGASMGASGSGQIALQRPELFDGVGMLGIPLVDWVYMLRNIERSFLGGFCDRETILANLDRINDPSGPAFCGTVRGEVKLEPSGRVLEPDQDFNHWYRWIDAGRGGPFGRNKLFDSFKDIALAFGNPLTYNEESPYLPPGVPLDFRDRSDAERCVTPVRVPGLFHKELNPTGEYDAIAFCDTSTNDGEFAFDRPSERATEIMLAFDYNNNGIRDYAEPVVVMTHERYEDVGLGPGDTYSWDTHPSGKAKNWIYDEGEPYEDNGLDGVAGTGDFGEGNGRFDYNPSALNYFAQNPRSLLERGVSDGHLERLFIYADAGIRDFLQSAGGTNWMWAAFQNRVGKARAPDHTTFKSLYADPSAHASYDALDIDFREENVGRHLYVRYGDPDATPQEIARGDGHHVGPADQVLARFITALAFFESRIYAPDRKRVVGVADFTTSVLKPSFQSTALGTSRSYGIVLPPGYEAPENSEKRYPVVYFLHGQGQNFEDLLPTALFFYGLQVDSEDPDKMRRQESDWAKFIIVFPDSNCDADACSTGNFNANHLGVDGNGPKYMDALYELMAEVETKYRTAIPIEVPLE